MAAVQPASMRYAGFKSISSLSHKNFRMYRENHKFMEIISKQKYTAISY